MPATATHSPSTSPASALPGSLPLLDEIGHARTAGPAEKFDPFADLALGEATSGCFVPPPDMLVAANIPGAGFARETGGQFTLGQNHPNPYTDETTVPFTLTNPADVRLDLFDPLGRKVAGILRRGLDPGSHCIHLNLCGLGLPAGDYSYQLQVTSRYGTYRQRRVMTAAQ